LCSFGKNDEKEREEPGLPGYCTHSVRFQMRPHPDTVPNLCGLNRAARKGGSFQVESISSSIMVLYLNECITLSDVWLIPGNDECNVRYGFCVDVTVLYLAGLSIATTLEIAYACIFRIKEERAIHMDNLILRVREHGGSRGRT